MLEWSKRKADCDETGNQYTAKKGKFTFGIAEIFINTEYELKGISWGVFDNVKNDFVKGRSGYKSIESAKKAVENFIAEITNNSKAIDLYI